MLSEENHVKLGVIEFHSQSVNPGLTERFFAVTSDLRDAGSIVDVWLVDIATVLGEFGYDMRICRSSEAQKRWEAKVIDRSGTPQY